MTTRNLVTLEEFSKSPAKGVTLRKQYAAAVRATQDDDLPEDASKPGGRRVTFTLSTETVDRMGDTIAADGWDLENYRKNPVVLFAHNSQSPPVGKSLREWAKDGALSGVTEFVPRDLYPFGHMIGEMYGLDFMKAVSVGFDPTEFAMNEERAGQWGPGCDFKKQELLEYSCVPVPANPEALVAAKSAGIDMAPMREWLEKTIDGLPREDAAALGLLPRGKRSDGFWMSRETLEAALRAATGRTPRSQVQVPRGKKDLSDDALQLIDVAKNAATSIRTLADRLIETAQDEGLNLAADIDGPTSEAITALDELMEAVAEVRDEEASAKPGTQRARELARRRLKTKELADLLATCCEAFDACRQACRAAVAACEDDDDSSLRVAAAVVVAACDICEEARDAAISEASDGDETMTATLEALKVACEGARECCGELADEITEEEKAAAKVACEACRAACEAAKEQCEAPAAPASEPETPTEMSRKIRTLMRRVRREERRRQ